MYPPKRESLPRPTRDRALYWKREEVILSPCWRIVLVLTKILIGREEEQIFVSASKNIWEMLAAVNPAVSTI